MPLSIHTATSEDVPTLIAILFTAFANDSLLMKCYPDTPANRGWWKRSVQAQMQNPETRVYKVVDSELNQIVAFAKWLIDPGTVRAGNGEELSGAVQPVSPTTDMDVESCESLAAAQYTMRERMLGGRGHFWLNAMATSPQYQRQGAATMLVKFGVEQADKEGLECFSACTNDANRRVSRILNGAGFEITDQESVIEQEGLSVFGGWRRSRAPT